jgi:alpha-glucosidase
VLPRLRGERLELHLYPPWQGTGGGELYSDAGDGYGEARGDRIELERSGRDLILTWQEQGRYPFPFEGVGLQVHAAAPKRLSVDGREVGAARERIEVGMFEQAIITF